MLKLAVYIAAPWVAKDQALEAQKKFEQAGFVVTSHWITYHSDAWPQYGTPALAPEKNERELTRQAIEDLRDIEDSDAFVILNLDKSEGKATELGYAYALGLPVVLVGERSRNIFYHLPTITRVDTVEDAIEYLGELVEVARAVA